jgi:PKD repeat protein
MSRQDDLAVLNLPGQTFRAYVGFGNEIKIAVDRSQVSPLPTTYPAKLGMVPYRPTACLGPHRIGFVDEPLPFYGGYSYSRWRVAAFNHQWHATGPGGVTIYTAEDTTQWYRDGSGESAAALMTFSAPGVYTVSLTVQGVGSSEHPITEHTGTRQVIIYPSRYEAFSGVMQIAPITGSIEQGGFTTQLMVKGDVGFLLKARELDGYIPVVIYADLYFETSYGTWERKEIGPNWDFGKYHDDPRIIFSGYIDNETITVTPDQTSVTFNCRTADLILEQMQTSTWGFFENARDGAGITFNDLMTHDVIRHMLQEHSNFIDWHDTRLQYNMRDYPYPTGQMQGMEYRDWTFQQGMYWSNIRDTADNQFEQAFVDARSSLVVMPDRNMWEPTINQRPEELNPTQLAPFVHRYMENQPISIVSVEPDAFTNVPLEIRVSSRMSQAVSYYKIIGTLSYSNEEWGGDYPYQHPRPATGRWVLVQGKYYSDDDRTASWDRLWRFAARGYAAANTRYQIEVIFGIHIYWREGDIVEVIFADETMRVNFARTSGSSQGENRNWFEVTAISYELNLDSLAWKTSYSLRELTTYTAPNPDIPTIPPIPKQKTV